jgi:membrane-bound lytic murein transglycosylase D
MPSNPRLFFLAAAALLLSGCAVETRDETPSQVTAAVEPSPSDPFQAVDDAFERLALDRVPVEPAAGDDTEAAGPRSIWPRLVDRFRIAECPTGSRAEAWAQWYADNHEYLGRVFNRARPWLHEIANEVERRDLPGELALLPVVESAFDPFAYSHARAAGPWQFLSGTARDHGVVINDWYDGRRDFVVATDAALQYLEYLNGLFDGDWALAIAAYNAGQGRVARAVRRNAARGRGTSWDELPLPRETRGYVPKIKGLGCLVRDPAAYGYQLPELIDQPRVATLDLPGSIDLVELALRAELDLAELITLNAGLNKHRTPPTGPHHLTVPLEAADRTRAALADLPVDTAVAWQNVDVRPGDSLSVLARRHQTTVQALKTANGLQNDRLIAGQTLRLPGTVDTESESLDPDYLDAYRQLADLQQQLLPADRFIHRVRSGESLWVIARRYGLSVRELQQMNGMGSNALIRPGQRLVIETGRQPPPAAQPTQHVVRRGDSLWNISRQHRVDLDELMRWNGLDADSVLQPGQELVIRRSGGA